MKTIYFTAALFIGLLSIFQLNAREQAIKDKPAITIVHGSDEPAPVAHGLIQLKKALTGKGMHFSESTGLPRSAKGPVIVAGIAANSEAVSEMLSASHTPAPSAPEAALIRRSNWHGTPALIVTGADERGAMYALLETAQQIAALPADADIIGSITEVNEKPFARERSLSTAVRSEHIRNGYFHDPKYWDLLFEQLAASRINSYNLILKYRPPIYTLFFDVDGTPPDQTNGIVVSPEEQQRNLAALQSIVQKAHDHGVKITLGIWNHVANPDDAERLSSYTEAAIAKLIQLVPIDAFQLRMHWESGLPRDLDVLDEFWGRVFDGIKNSGRDIRIFPRAKGLSDRVIQLAIDKEMNFAIATKYSAEQMGLPFHPAHIQTANQLDRRHGYADLLSYPKRWDMMWRVWSGGSQKLLLWGNLDYTRRWVESTMLYGSGIFEFMEIEGAERMGDGSVRALTDGHVYTDYEFQRYWCQNLMYGRIGYNPDTPERVFLREFNKRFGDEAGPVVMQALSNASMIIPRIISSSLPDFQEARGVPEWGNGGGLGEKGRLESYANVKPTDIQTFISFAEAAELIIEGGESARVWPHQNADWFAAKSSEILTLADKAVATIGSHRSKEFESTMTDVRILATIAKVHSERIIAAIAYNLYLKLKDNKEALDTAIQHEAKAIELYRDVVAAAGDFYRTDIDVSNSDTGHWRDELVMWEKTFEELKNTEATGNAPMPALDFRDAADREPPAVSHEPLLYAEPGRPVTINATITDPSGVKWARVLCRGVTQFQDYKVVEMVRDGDTFSAVIPAEMLDEVTEYNPETGALWDFMYLIEAMDNKKNGCITPDFEKTDPYVFVQLPHKTIEETGGKVTASRIRDKTYLPGFQGGATNFRILSPVDNDVFLSGSDIPVKLKRPSATNEREVIEIYIDGKMVKSEKRGDLEYVIKGLENGVYRVKALYNKERGRAQEWSNTVEIGVGQSRQRK